MAEQSGTRKKTSLPASSSGRASLAPYLWPLSALLLGTAAAVALLAPYAALTPAVRWLCMAVTVAVAGVGAWRGARGSFRRTPAGERFGQYTLHEKIGEGGMGVVFRATHALLGRQAAVKLLAAGRESRESLERFEREAELTSRLTHPNTIAVYDSGRTASGIPFYAMEYLEGLDLQTLVDQHGPQDPRRVAHLLAQIAGALSEAHGIGLVHRDVKPANVMLCERGGAHDVAKVLDFGLTKELGAPAELDTTDGGRLVGTPLYLPPEAIVSPERLDARSDLYAVGALGYFLLTGEPPFSGGSIAEVCAHHLHTTPLPPSRRAARAVPPALEALILRCLAKSPEDRPESAATVRTALLDLAATWTADDADCWWEERHAVGRRATSLLESGSRIEHAPTLLYALAG
jgi:serine/threonine-protein kinase